MGADMNLESWCIISGLTYKSDSKTQVNTARCCYIVISGLLGVRVKDTRGVRLRMNERKGEEAEEGLLQHQMDCNAKRRIHG
ncbi:unnamed protein product [Boreogadus saida]